MSTISFTIPNAAAEAVGFDELTYTAIRRGIKDRRFLYATRHDADGQHCRIVASREMAELLAETLRARVASHRRSPAAGDCMKAVETVLVALTGEAPADENLPLLTPN